MPIIDDDYVLTFGKYKGEKIANVPATYLVYMYDSGKCNFSVATYFEANESLIREEALT
jgi:uncharacterized protein (DUF3820 family)